MGRKVPKVVYVDEDEFEPDEVDQKSPLSQRKRPAAERFAEYLFFLPGKFFLAFKSWDSQSIFDKRINDYRRDNRAWQAVVSIAFYGAIVILIALRLSHSAPPNQ